MATRMMRQGVQGEVGDVSGLTVDEARAVRVMASPSSTRFWSGLDEVEAFLRVAFPGWFVYRGGSHVALHRMSGGPRLVVFSDVMVATEAGR